MQLRTVFDSNVYVAAGLRPGGHAGLWLDIAMLPGSSLQLFVSQAILDEVYDKLVNTFGIPAKDMERLVGRIQAAATVVEPTEQVTVVDDPDDNAILECALAAKAHLVVSADRALLKLNPYQGIGIARPSELRHIFTQDFARAA